LQPEAIIAVITPAVAVAVVVLRHRRPRRLRPYRLWILPALLCCATALTLLLEPRANPLSTAAYAGFAAATALGVLLGWWRSTHIVVNHGAGGELFSQPSRLGLLIILAVLGLRQALHSGAGALPIDPSTVSDGLLLFAIGAVVAQRAELWTRARRLTAAVASPEDTPAPRAY